MGCSRACLPSRGVSYVRSDIPRVLSFHLIPVGRVLSFQARALSELLSGRAQVGSSSSSSLDGVVLREVLACLFMLAVIVPDLSLLGEALPALCAYARRWHPDLARWVVGSDARWWVRAAEGEAVL
jgi:hypothetical protein